MKSFEMIPTEENLIQALSKDILQRNKQLLYFYNLLLAQEGASTIAIDGRWGSGKTFFVKQSMLVINAKNPMSKMDNEKRIKITHNIPFPKNDDAEDENYDLAIYYDAWENDNDTDPVLSIIYEMTKQLSLTYPFESDTNIFKLAGAIAETITGKSVKGIIETLKSENPLTKFKAQKELEDRLKEFFSDVLEERGNRLVVFVDELDRCKPSYAVHLLEQIKHYLCDERITFAFSVNLEELQHTIKHYYGTDFDACRYLDRFFNLRIALPPADKENFYNIMGLNSNYVLEIVSKKVIENYNFELREITRYYKQVKAAVYEPTHESRKWDFSFSDGKARQMILLYIVPIVIGLKIVDISLHDDFINGRNPKPLLDIFDGYDFSKMVLSNFLNRDESFENEEGKKVITEKEVIKKIYNAIFVNDYKGSKYNEILGDYQFDASSKKLAIETASMLSGFAEYDI